MADSITDRVRVAVIGAGMAGATAARLLHEHGFAVRVYEKSRGTGGRLATRREGGESFDLGAQYFTVRDDTFRRYVESWQERHLASPWKPRLAVVEDGTISPLEDRECRFVGVPGMNAPVKQLLEGIAFQPETSIIGLAHTGGVWRLIGDGPAELPECDRVVVAVPADQAVGLLTASPRIRERARQAVMQPCWALAASFDYDFEMPIDAAFVHEGPLLWIARNGSKPGRTHWETWVIHATPAWSRAHLEESPEQIAPALLRAFLHTLRLPATEPRLCRAHRWRYASPERPLSESCLWDAERGLGACGDWCHSARVEGAFRSGWALAEKIIAGREADRLIRGG